MPSWCEKTRSGSPSAAGTPSPLNSRVRSPAGTLMARSSESSSASRPHAAQVFERSGDPRAQLLESLLVVLEARRLLCGQPRDRILRHVTGDLHLPHQRQHVGRQSRADQHGGIDFPGGGMARTGLENGAEISQRSDEYFDRQGVHRNPHEFSCKRGAWMEAASYMLPRPHAWKSCAPPIARAPSGRMLPGSGTGPNRYRLVGHGCKSRCDF